jgi:hypothetical protein
MRSAAALVLTMLLLPVPVPDDKSVDFDPQTDFSQFKSFTIGPGQLQSNKPELKGDIVRKKIQEALRGELTKRGLQEEPNQTSDLFVAFRLGSADKREVESWPAGRWGRRTVYTANRFSEGTLVVDLLKKPGRELVWRGIYRDDETNASKISSNLQKDIQKLFDKYPSKKK